jgi:hypothetical protein
MTMGQYPDRLQQQCIPIAARLSGPKRIEPIDDSLADTLGRSLVLISPDLSELRELSHLIGRVNAQTFAFLPEPHRYTATSQKLR